MVLIINQRYTVSWSYFNRKDCELESKTKRKKEERNIVMKLIWVNREERRVEDKGTLKSRVRSIEYKGRENTSISLCEFSPWMGYTETLFGRRKIRSWIGREERTHCSETLSPESMHVEQGFEPALQSQTDHANHITIKLPLRKM